MNPINVAQLERDGDIDGLLAALPRAFDRTRVALVDAIGRIGDERAVPALTLMLDDPYSVDPADLHRGDRAWEEMGDESLIYPVRDAARKALQNIASRPAGVPVKSPALQVGDLVKAYRYFFLHDFEDGEGTGSLDCVWKILDLGPGDVHLSLEKGKFWERDSVTMKGIFRTAGFTTRMKNSYDYDKTFPGSLPYQEFLDTFKKVG